MLLINADASPALGSGHVMRCLALVQAAQKIGKNVILQGRINIPWVQQRLEQENINFKILSGSVPNEESPVVLLKNICTMPEGTWVVLDGYHFNLQCQKAVRNAGFKLLLIDDYAHLPEYSCDILLNQNINAGELIYRGNIGQKLLGVQYSLLRQEFMAEYDNSYQQNNSQFPQKLLLTLGGGDALRFLYEIAPCFTLPELEGCLLRIAAGSMSEDKVRAALSGSPAKLEIVQPTASMPALLRDTQLCVTAGGSTCWELCYLGIPFLTVQVADNQSGIVAWFQQNNIAPCLSKEGLHAFLTNPDLCRRRGEVMHKIVDGRGAERVLLCMKG